MTRQRCPGQRKFFLSLGLLLFVSLVVVTPAPGQQNGTYCPQRFENAPGQNLFLNLDTYCDENNNAKPVEDPYQEGSGHPHVSCYRSNDGTLGLTHSCYVCPPDHPNCTPCPNYASTCGTHTPDPPPDTSGSNRIPARIRNATYALLRAIDWLTA